MGFIPSDLLHAIICPLHKGGSRSVPKNFRPVALTSHVIKVFERVIRKFMVNHLESNGYMTPGTPQLYMNMSHLAIESSVKNILSNFIILN